MRRSIPERMHASLHNTAQLMMFTEVDVTEMIRFRGIVREKYNKDDTVRISYNDLVILATSRALKHHPIMNSTLVGDEILLHDSVYLGIAVALPEGLIVPVLWDADKKGLLEIASGERELARKAREGTLTVDEATRGNVYHFKCGHVSGGRGPGQRVSANRGPLSGRSLFNHDVICKTHLVYRNQGNVKDKGMVKKEMHIPNNRLRNQ